MNYRRQLVIADLVKSEIEKVKSGMAQ